MKKLENKVAVVYSDGTVGGAVAKAFAKEGATVFLTGRTKSKLEAISSDIKAAGGSVETAILDALDGKAIEEHMHEIIKKAGRVDISFNAIGIPQTGIQGIPLTELSLESFNKPLRTYVDSHFLTSRAAARRMVKQGSGVILIHTPNASRISWPYVGGMIPAWAALEALGRSLSVEYGPSGVRAVSLQTTAILETPLIDEVFDIQGKSTGLGFEEFTTNMKSTTHNRHLTTLSELAAAAVFVASEEGRSITGSIFNMTAGMVVY